MIGRDEHRSSDAPGAAAGSSARIAGFANSSSPRGLTIATASSSCSTADSRLRHLPGHLRSIGRQLRADRVEEGAELAELVVLIQIEPDAELAACPRRVRPLRIT